MALNLCFLAAIVLVPFSANLYDDFTDEPIAAAVFGATLGVAGADRLVDGRARLRTGSDPDRHRDATAPFARRRGLGFTAAFVLSVPAAYISAHLAEGSGSRRWCCATRCAGSAAGPAFAVDRADLAGDVGPVEGEHVLAGLGDEAVAQLGVGQQPLGHRRQRARVAGAEAQPHVAVDHLAQAARVGHQAGQPDAIASSATRPNGS